MILWSIMMEIMNVELPTIINIHVEVSHVDFM